MVKRPQPRHQQTKGRRE